MDSKRMNNGVSEYRMILTDWVNKFWQRNYPYEYSKEQLGDMINDVTDEKRDLRNKAFNVMKSEINKIIEEREKYESCDLGIESVDLPALSLSEQEQVLAKMKERIIGRLYEEKVTPGDYRDLLGKLQNKIEMLEK